MNWFKRLIPASIRTQGSSRRSVPEGLWTSCPECKAMLYRAELERNFDVCVKCGHHLRIGARRRLLRFLDQGSGREIGADIAPVDFLKFKDGKRYRDRLAAAQKSTGENDALVVMEGAVESVPLVAAAFEFGFMGGSMGSVVGERFVRGVRRCLEARLPYVCFCASGGARMQEALVSLMQMAKTSAALAELREARLPYVVVLADRPPAASRRARHAGYVSSPSRGADRLRRTARDRADRAPGLARSTNEFLLEHGAST